MLLAFVEQRECGVLTDNLLYCYTVSVMDDRCARSYRLRGGLAGIIHHKTITARVTEYQPELSTVAPRHFAAPRVPTISDGFIGVGATDNFLVSQTMTLKLETKMIFITRYTAIETCNNRAADSSIAIAY